MSEFKGFVRGVNLGGWLSQCGYEKEHLETFITEKDIERINRGGQTTSACRLTSTLSSTARAGLSPMVFCTLTARLSGV